MTRSFADSRCPFPRPNFLWLSCLLDPTSYLPRSNGDPRHPLPPTSSKADSTLKLYYAQLVLNQLWSVLFFGQQQMTLALVDIVALLASITKMAQNADEVTSGEKVGSGWFLWPYVAWVSYGECGKNARGGKGTVREGRVLLDCVRD